MLPRGNHPEIGRTAGKYNRPAGSTDRPMPANTTPNTTGRPAVTAIEALKSSVRLCMFDQYGTVVDMQGGLRDFATGFLQAKGWGGDPSAFVTWWRRTHFENSMIDALLGREHTSYREIGHLSVRQVMHRAGIAHTEDDVRTLVAAIERLRCFPEVPAALARLQ